jgi:hypothetical protein
MFFERITPRLVAIESRTRNAGVVMTVKVNEGLAFHASGRLVTVMVQPMPVPEGMTETDAVIDLLRRPATLFGPAHDQHLPDARCAYTTWDDLLRPLQFLHRGGVTVTYVRHLLHLAAHFAHRHSLRRAGSAVIALFEGDGNTSLRYDLPLRAPQEVASAWTKEFWDELNYVDLLQPNFLIQFTDEVGEIPAPRAVAPQDVNGDHDDADHDE